MKKYLSGTAAVFLLAVTPAAAADLYVPGPEAVLSEAQWDAFISVGAGYRFYGGGGVIDELNDFSAEARASAAYQMDNGFGVQGDLVFAHQGLGDLLGDGVDSKTADVAAHVFYRNEDFLVGVFGQYGLTSSDFFLSPDLDRYYFGAEAQAYFGAFTLAAQGGIQTVDSASILLPDADMNGYFANVEGRYFVTDNLKLSLNAGFSALDIEDTIDHNTFTIGASAEYRLDDSPISGFLSVQHSSHSVDGLGPDIDFSDTRLLAGVKLNLGTDTLLERDRSGASLNPVQPRSRLTSGFLTLFP